MTSKPYQNSRLALYISKRVLELRPKTQAEIATAAGYPNPNMLTMIKQGSSKLALDRVPALADALECDPRFLFRLAFEQVIGSSELSAIEEVFGTVVSRRETVWLKEIRNASGGTDPVLTARMRIALRAIFGK